MTADGSTPTDRPDLRLVPVAATAWLAALASGFVTSALLLTGVGVLACTGGVVLVRCRGDVRRVVGVALICAGAMAIGVALRLASVETGPVPMLAHDRAIARLSLVVTSDARLRSTVTIGSARAPNGVVVDARLERIEARGRAWRTRVPVLILAPTQGWSHLVPSQHIDVTARLDAPTHGGIAAVVTPRGPPSRIGPPSRLERIAASLRRGLSNAAGVLPADERGLLPGLVDGDTSRLPQQLATDCKTTGLTHLVAVSGTNVAFVAVAALLAARWAGLRARAVPAVGLLSILAFLVLARPEPSVLRATVTGIVGVIALVRGGRRAGLASLCAAIVVLLLMDPALGRSFGFALSVLATGGLLVLAPGWRRSLARWLPTWLADSVAVPAAAQLVCAPVIVVLSGNVSLVAIPANLLAAPAVAPATILGVLTALAAPVSPTLAAVFARLAGIPVAWIVAVAHTGAEAPYATLPWPNGWAGAALLAVVTVFGCYVAPRIVRRPPAMAACVAGLLVLVSPWGPHASWPPAGWLMVACDVGQGDGLVISTAPHHALLVDTGPDPRAEDRCLRRLDVRTLDLILLTHFHADHVEGLPGALERRRAGGIVVSPLDDPPEEAARVRGWAAAANVPVRVVTMGEVDNIGGVTWRVLWPARIIRGEGSDPNNASIAMLLTTGGVRLLLTGDVEAPAQEALLAQASTDGVDLHADVLKVPHHGSANQDPSLLQVVAPRLAVVSVGAGNPYGHPSLVTMARLAAAGVPTGRTDRDGDVAVVGPLNRLRLVTAR